MRAESWKFTKTNMSRLVRMIREATARMKSRSKNLVFRRARF